MPEPLYVDPERLVREGRPYEAAAQNWYRLQDRIAGIRSRYAGAWGDDDMGNQFGPSFDQGMDAVELRAQGVGETLGYYGEGLVENGKIFADAREGAEDSSYSFLQETNYIGGHEAPGYTNPYLPGENAYAPGENTEGEVTTPVTPRYAAQRRTLTPDEEELPPGYSRGMLVQGKLLTPDDELTPLQPTLSLRRESLPALPAEEGTEPLQPTYSVARSYAKVEPAEEGLPLRPAYMSRRPTVEAEEALPLQPAYLSPALPGIPAIPAVEGEELEPLQPAYITPALPGIPGERLPLEPLMYGERHEALPAIPATPVENPVFVRSEKPESE